METSHKRSSTFKIFSRFAIFKNVVMPPVFLSTNSIANVEFHTCMSFILSFVYICMLSSVDHSTR